jgi:sulfur carrier protein ThiS
MKMTIHEALSRIKMTEKRIAAAANAQFVVANRHNNTKIDGKDISAKVEELKAAKQSFEALVRNYRTLKSAVAMSNAATSVTVGDKTYTVVEAIEEKHFAEDRINYLKTIRRSYEMALNTANSNNARVPEGAERFVASLNMSEKNGNSKEDIKKTMDTYIVDNTWELVDPNNAAEWLKEMEKDITDFTSNIDFKLSESNATTVIDVDLVSEE